ncbi:MAG TPA: GNAT family N-acetyltransferase [Polyangiaceae bacterium]|nr:GNAT family N-acetyltransferase [Polyangiaceae bacterium]
MSEEIGFRALASQHLPLLQAWLTAPHVDRWWHGPQDLAGVRAKYLPRIDGREPSHVFLIESGAVPVGWIQWYRWADYPVHAAQLGASADSAGVDLAIGEVEQIGLGLGSRALRTFVDHIVFAQPGIAACLSDPQTDNTRSVRAFLKAGFAQALTIQLTGEPYTRALMRRARQAGA